MSQIAISVPVGAYHPLIEDCLQSLIIQTPAPEVAFLDASGDPRVKAVADKYADHLAYRRHGPDSGQSDAILEGWENTNAPILGWLNADDALYPGAMEVAIAAFDRSASGDRPDVVYGHSMIIDDAFAFTGFHWAVEPPSDRLLHADIISQPSCFFRRELHERVGKLNKDLHYTMDWDLWVRFWQANARFEFIDQTFSKVLWTEEAKTGGFGKGRRTELDRIINQNANASTKLKSKVGFALHHAFEYMMPKNVARQLRRTLAPSQTRIHGLGRNGEIDQRADIPLVHYIPDGVRSLQLQFNQPANNIDIDLTFRHQVDRKGAQVGVQFETPWQAAHHLQLQLTNLQGSGALLERIFLHSGDV